MAQVAARRGEMPTSILGNVGTAPPQSVGAPPPGVTSGGPPRGEFFGAGGTTTGGAPPPPSKFFLQMCYANVSVFAVFMHGLVHLLNIFSGQRSTWGHQGCFCGCLEVLILAVHFLAG